MKVSLNTIRYIDEHFGCSVDPTPDGIDGLIKKIGAQLGEIEESVDVGSRYKDILVVRVVSCVDHPDADRLHLCKVDDGGKVQNVERDESGHVQVVCGAPNVREGMLAAWLPPGSTVPSTVDKDPFVLESRIIREQQSNGMLASPRELGLGDSHEGILQIDEDVTPGTSFAEISNLANEIVIDIENKMFTHRPDCFGFLGIARELAGIQQQMFKSPDWYVPKPDFPSIEAAELKLEVRNELPELVPRFCAVTMSGVTVKPSPLWLQALLSSVGLRPINNIVDYTNYFMLLSAQPLHAYDYDKVKSQDKDADHATLVARKPQTGEKLLLLNGKEVSPSPDTIMIATRDRAIGIGGVMGGGETEVDEHTKNIIIECANFDMCSIRKTSMSLGLFTDAVTRFTKGQSPLQNLAVLARIVNEIREHAGGRVALEVVDDDHVPGDILDRNSMHEPIGVSAGFINSRLGLTLVADEISALLRNVEFDVQQTGDQFVIKAPFWRTDIEISEDIVEEVGRLYGYDHLPLELPKRDVSPAPIDALLSEQAAVRSVLVDAGANEVLTYSFVHGNLLDKVGQDKSKAFQLNNALSPDLQYYRLSMTPSLLDIVHANVKAGFGEFALFEIGKAHCKDFSDGEGLPKEFERVALVFAADRKSSQSYEGAPYYQARKYLVQLLKTYNLDTVVRFEPISDEDKDQAITYYQPGRSATVRVGDAVIGRIGEYKSSVRQALKLPDFCAGFELGLTPLLEKGSNLNKYTPLSRFPSASQDITLRVAADVSFADLYEGISGAISNNAIEDSSSRLEALDIFQRPEDQAHKNITFRYTTANVERTLTDVEVAKVLDNIAGALKDTLGAERV